MEAWVADVLSLSLRKVEVGGDSVKRKEGILKKAGRGLARRAAVLGELEAQAPSLANQTSRNCQ